MSEIKKHYSNAVSVLKRGQIAITKKKLELFIAVVNSVEKNMDVIMTEKESHERGKKISHEINRLNFARHTFQHFELNIPLNKLK